MKYVVNVPEDIYTISAGSYKLVNSHMGINKVMNYNKETNTSENFLKKLVNFIQVNTNYFNKIILIKIIIHITLLILVHLI